MSIIHPPRASATLLALFCLLLTAALSAPDSRALAAESGAPAPPAPAERQVTLKGEIVDLACYLSHEGKGDGHATCAKACVRGGAPVGLLADGQLFVLFAPHESASPFEEAKKLAGGKAEITGTIHDRNGLKGLAVIRVVGRS